MLAEDWEKAIATLTEYVDPSLVAVYHQKGLVCQVLKKYEKAVRRLASA